MSPSTTSGWLAVNLTIGQQVAQQSSNLRSPTPACLLTATPRAAADALLELHDDLLRYSTSQTLSPKPSSSGMDCGLYHCQSMFLIGNKLKLQGARKNKSLRHFAPPILCPHSPKQGHSWHYPSSEYENNERYSPEGQRLALSCFVCTQKLLLLNLDVVRNLIKRVQTLIWILS